MANPTVYTQADLDFVEGMVPHHAQALEMAELAAERARDERVKAIAERIIAAQGPEIAALQAWRESQGLPAVDEESMHSGMVGMASEEQLLALEKLAVGVRQQSRGEVDAYLVADPDTRVPLLVDLPVVRDAERTFAAAYGVAGAGTAAYLVRPDGHVGFRTRPVTEAALLDHLAGVFAQ